MDFETTVLVDLNPEDGFWVFAYGSLMWNPGFEAAEHQLARLQGYTRSFCMRSIVYRGTPEAPGLVLALDAKDGASCSGVAYRVAPENGPAALDYLRERELVSSAYQEAIAELVLEDGRHTAALAYVMDRNHEQYCGALSLSEQADIIARAAGPAGPNAEYLLNTAQRMRELGLQDATIFELVERVKSLT